MPPTTKTTAKHAKKMLANRKFDRYGVSIPVRLTVDSRIEEIQTSDVSFQGLFLRTRNSPPLRALVRLEIDTSLPNPLVLYARVIRVVDGGPGAKVTGVAVQLYGNDRRTLRTWRRYIQSFEDEQRYAREG